MQQTCCQYVARICYELAVYDMRDWMNSSVKLVH